jgi:hypothetical protein
VDLPNRVSLYISPVVTNDVFIELEDLPFFCASIFFHGSVSFWPELVSCDVNLAHQRTCGFV